jgi:two-component system sensor histidine kinase RstB
MGNFLQRLFVRIYGTILFSIILVLLVSYFALASLNQYRYSAHLQEVLSGTTYLLSLGAQRQQGEKQQRWLSLASSLMDANIVIESDSNSNNTQPEEIQQLGGQHSEAERFAIRKRLIDVDEQIVIEFGSLTEQVITGTAFLLLNEIGRHPVARRQQVFDEIGQAFNYPIFRIPSQELPLDSQQYERLSRGETVVVWNKQFGRGLSINVYAPWGKTSDVLSMGSIQFFDPYPPQIILSFALVALLLMAISVMFSIKHLASRLYKLQDKVDAISPTYLQDFDQSNESDAITQLHLKIQNMASRIDKLLDEKTNMIRGISHDLRTPISKIHFRLESLSISMGDNNSMIQGCRNDLKQLNLLIDELLTYEKLSVKQEIKINNIDIVDLASRQIQGFQMIYPTLSISLQNKLDATFFIGGNEILLNRLFENLLNNAGRYADTQVQICLSADHERLTIIVNDDGDGLEEEYIPHVFDPFFQVDQSRNVDLEGYGLGLAIVKQVAMQHGGDIWVMKNQWEGASFVLNLPIKPVKKSNVAANSQDSQLKNLTRSEK